MPKGVSMKNLLSYLLMFLMGMAAAAGIFLIASPPRGTAVELQAAPTSSPLTIQVAGAVKQPGVYPLPRDSRVQDAIQAAGGFTQEADPDQVNLAARLKDGERINVPIVGEIPAAPPTSADRSVTIDATPSAPVNLNTATSEELQTLPGVGPSKAAAIIAYREAHSGFKTLDEIQEVPGFGPATFERLKDMITVE
jgi:competence protein ComEA